jgi:cyanophycinase-like exopeptidase
MMSGPVALVGAGEFCASMVDFDAGLLAATGRQRPRVAILATAAFPMGQAAFQRASEIGTEHFRALGAEVEAVTVTDRAAAGDPANAQAVGEADLIYLCGGDSAYLGETLLGSLVWAAAVDANRRGAILVGCAAGAMVLGKRRLDVGVRLGWPIRWREALGAAGGVAVFPEYDARPEPVLALLAMRAPRGLPVLGIDRETAVIGRAGSWEVHGAGRVTVWHGRRRERHRHGEAFRLFDPPDELVDADSAAD